MIINKCTLSEKYLLICVAPLCSAARSLVGGILLIRYAA